MLRTKHLNLSTTQWIVLGTLGLALAGSAAIFGLFVLSVMLPGNGPGGDTPIVQTPTESPLASISGVVWHDLCVSGRDGEPAPSTAPAGCVPLGGGYQANGVLEAGEPGLGGVLVRLGAGACPAADLKATLTSEDGRFEFTSLRAGDYCVSIDSLASQHASLLLPGSWTAPAGQAEVSLATLALSLQAGEARQGANFGWDHQFLPAPDPAPTQTPTPGASCTDRAAFVADITYADNSNLPPGRVFDKIWRLRNAGTCTWTTSYALVFAGGHAMTGTTVHPLSASVAPGQTVDLKITLTSPTANGIYHGDWLLRNANGVLFGLGDAADRPFWVQIVVGPSGSAVNGAWKGEYFANRELKGTPALVRSDAVIDFDWGRNAPAANLPADGFSVRWTGRAEFEAATYRFRATVDDGVRLWVDDVLVIDAWKDGSSRELIGEISLTKGTHSLRMEYYDNLHDARARLRWENIGAAAITEWKGEYFANRDLKGAPALVRNDQKVEFNWGSRSPAAGLPEDSFSVRWTRQINFEGGVYRFSARADDGIRVLVNGVAVIDEWHASAGTTVYVADRNLPPGKQTVVIEYYEGSGQALVQVGWERLTTTPTPTDPPPTDPPPTEPPPTDPPPTDPPPTEPPPQEPTIALSFSQLACNAEWRNAAGPLPCPGTEGDAGGFVLTLMDPTLEGGVQRQGRALWTAAQAVEQGLILGIYPAFKVESGDRFRATLGCLNGEEACNVTFRLEAWVDLELPQTLGTWKEVADGQLTKVDLDLSAFSGRTVTFVLSVYSEQAAGGQGGVWLQPRVVR